MNPKHLTTFIILTFLLSTILPTFTFQANAALETDEKDGIWTIEIDEDSHQHLTYDNTIYIPEERAILLNTSSNIKTYDFNDAGHRAYGFPTNLVALFQIPLFKPYRLFWERLFGFDEYNDIEKIDGDDDQGYADRSTEGKRSVVQHFRFNINIKESLINSIQVQWFGKATGDTDITLYYYRYITQNNIIGGWTQLKQSQSDGNDITIIGDIPGSDIPNAINNEKILDIYVVATRASSSCTLYTDYINITTQTKIGYDLGFGHITTTNTIDPKTISKVETFYWEQLTWKDYTDADTDITYQLLYENTTNTNEYLPIPIEDLPGNDEGFTRAPILLNTLDIEQYEKLKIRANMTTTNPVSSPKLFELTITWQPDTNQWKDLFNYDFRIDIKNRLKLNKINNEGFLNLTPSQGNWPMLGNNPQNTRASDTKGAENNNIWWYAEVVGDDVRHEMLSPILYEGTIYATNLYSQIIHWCDDVITNPTNSKKTFDGPGGLNPIDFGNDLHIRNSPSVIENQLIVATGEEALTGVANKIYAVNIDNPEDNWFYEYDGNICYGSSPTAYGDYVFVTSYEPNPLDPTDYDTKLVIIDLDKKTDHWIFNLPANSFSAPAIYENIVIVCCKERTGKSVYALNYESKTSLWNKSLGEIGSASPVIYEDKVFITSKSMGSTKVTALDLNNGTSLWSKTIGSGGNADFTPSIYNDILYAALPKGTITALDTNNGNNLWTTDVIPASEPKRKISASPSYADGKLYIPISSDTFGIGSLIALETDTRDIQWRFNTFYSPRDNGVVSSPIITNGMVIFGDENGRIYSIGEYKKPDQQLEGTLISMPIELPPGAWWDKFYTKTNTTTGVNSITFQLLDEDKNKLTNLANGATITLGQGSTTRKARLRADFTADNLTNNPQLFSWNITFTKDEIAPEFDIKTFKPGSEGWLNEIAKQFSIRVQDKGTGLLINSAEYTLTYEKAGETKTVKQSAMCTGSNGTTNPQTIRVDIGNESFFQNITALKDIVISIRDLANNLNTTKITFRQDTQKPTSNVQNETIKDRYTKPTVFISASAKDPGTPQNASGIASVALVYRYSNNIDPDFTGNWITHSTTNSSPYEFKFTATEGGGWYELTTIATDIIGNSEPEPENGDVSFIMDSVAPNQPDTSTFKNWYNDQPEFSLTFEDDFLLDGIEYKPNFETEWTLVEAGVHEHRYSSTWSLKSSYWDQMNEGDEYFLHLQITDYLGNMLTIITNDIKIYKDTKAPNIAVEAPEIAGDWTWDDNFEIKAFAEDSTGSGIQTVNLEYSYSEDNSTYGDWIQYEDEITTSDITWDFNAKEGNGFYKFRITAIDNAGNQAESILIVGFNFFPATLVGALFALLVILILLTLFFIWWKKKNPVKK